MDEQTWLTSQDARKMYRHVSASASARQLRLVACACVRLVWDYLRDDDCKRALSVAERFADGLATEDELRQAELACFEVTRAHDFSSILNDPILAVTRVALGATQRVPLMAAEEALTMSALAGSPWEPEELEAPVPLDMGQNTDRGFPFQANLLREILGNPFRPEPFHPDWLAWDHGTVGRLAEAIYAEQRWQDLPVLADALEEAGCDNAEILAHCRGPGPHVRGCWVVDLARGVFDPPEPRP